MSYWLKNVGQLLEKLDDRAEQVADERLLQQETTGSSDITSILEARGLASENHVDEDIPLEEGKMDNPSIDSQTDLVEEMNEEVTTAKQTAEDVSEFDPEAWPDVPDPAEDMVTANLSTVPSLAEVSDEGVDVESTSAIAADAEPATETDPPTETDPSTETVDTSPVDESNTLEQDEEVNKVETNSKQAESLEPNTPGDTDETPQRNPSAGSQTTRLSVAPFRATGELLFSNLKSSLKQSGSTTKSPSPASSVASSVGPSSRAATQLREAQKEARTLRRHVITLNSQLERSEAEVKAQREELERAAERIEKDRERFRLEKEAEKKRHAEEIQVLKDSHEKALKEMKERSDDQLESARGQLRDLEQRRMQEGGDMDKELSDAIQREQQCLQKLALVEDEKATLLSQIGTLQAQQDALGSRLESLSQTADSAMSREREAEDRLDEALSLHARQISQRNAREAELEKTVAELGAALVAARGEGSQPSGSFADQTAGDLTSQVVKKDALHISLENEIEALMGQLKLEQERSETIQRELKEVTKERTDEVSSTTTRQLEYDRKVNDLRNEISQLRRQIRESGDAKGSPSELEDATHIRELSEELLQLREVVIKNKTEISALKSRLKGALDRAEKAEQAAEQDEGYGGIADLERGSKVRRRGGRAKKASGAGFQGSMSSALFLSSAQGETGQRLGKGLDAVDDFLSKSGTVLRHNPIARLFFISYLLLLHFWTFVLLFVHTHGYDSFQSCGEKIPHGPQALMQAHQPIKEAVQSNANAPTR